MAIYKTEITSDNIPSDNPIHQRLLKPYMVVKNQVKGRVLELGCGEGRGVEAILHQADSYLGMDKISQVVDNLSRKYPEGDFVQAIFPPVKNLSSGQFDYIISFQVIEHIKNDRLFLEEIHRLLKPGGTAIISTPNRELSLSRNPWHIREYLANELKDLCELIFDKVDAKGISGNEKVMAYHDRNRQSVQRIMRFDILNLQYRLPAFILKLPYEILNRMNRNSLKIAEDELVTGITFEDYIISDNPASSLDLFYYLHKK